MAGTQAKNLQDNFTLLYTLFIVLHIYYILNIPPMKCCVSRYISTNCIWMGEGQGVGEGQLLIKTTPESSLYHNRTQNFLNRENSILKGQKSHVWSLKIISECVQSGPWTPSEELPGSH